MKRLDPARLAAPGRAALYALTSVAAIALAPLAHGELTLIENAEGQTGLTVFKMTVTPAAEPTPAFKYRLLPAEGELLPGNAALHYCRAFAEDGISGVWKSIYKEFGEEEVEGGDNGSWYSAERPLSDIPADKLRDAAKRFDLIVDQYVSRGTQRQHCDWGHNLEELRGLDIISMMLPEIQESRWLSRALMLRTRAALADGDFDRALEHLRMNYRLGQNTASDPILVSNLVGIAECSLSNYALVELMATKNAPNMYWAIAALPRPLIEVRPAVRYELGWGMKIFPIFGEAEKAEHTPEEWSRLLAQAMVDFTKATGTPAPIDPVVAHFGITGVALFSYPDAKRRLIDAGMDAGRVEKMPVGQVIAVDAAREYRRFGDECEKTWYVPFRLANKFGQLEKVLPSNKLSGGIGGIVAQLLLPAIGSVRMAQVRLEWQLNAIQTIEAIRLHAAETGKLPASLDDVKAVPLPYNPATGKPYQYRLNGDTAVLELPFSDGFPNVSWRFEISLAK